MQFGIQKSIFWQLDLVMVTLLLNASYGKRAGRSITSKKLNCWHIDIADRTFAIEFFLIRPK